MTCAKVIFEACHDLNIYYLLFLYLYTEMKLVSMVLEERFAGLLLMLPACTIYCIEEQL